MENMNLFERTLGALNLVVLAFCSKFPDMQQDDISAMQSRITAAFMDAAENALHIDPETTEQIVNYTLENSEKAGSFEDDEFFAALIALLGLG